MAIAHVERVGETKNSRKLNRDTPVRKLQVLQCPLAGTRQRSAVIASHYGSQMQFSRAPAEWLRKFANHPKRVLVVTLGPLGVSDIVQKCSRLEHGTRIVIGSCGH